MEQSNEEMVFEIIHQLNLAGLKSVARVTGIPTENYGNSGTKFALLKVVLRCLSSNHI